jgi:hypothetical protein
MHNAGLNHRLGKDAVDCIGRALQAVDDGDQDVSDAAVISSFMTLSQNLAPSVTPSKNGGVPARLHLGV